MYKALVKVSKERIESLDKEKAEEILTKILGHINKYMLTKDEEGYWISNNNDDNDIRLFCVDVSDDEDLLPYLEKVWMINNNDKYEDCIKGHYTHIERQKKYGWAEELERTEHEQD